jgi:ribulose-phosphate 3-epimerase
MHNTLKQIKSLGVRAGVVLNPPTPVNEVEPYLAEADLVLVMSVNPGWAGQAFLPAALDRLRAARARIDALPEKARPLLQIDGGITADNAAAAARAGADVLVSGSGVYRGDPAERIAAIRAAVAAD